jgi:hypothetical protein
VGHVLCGLKFNAILPLLPDVASRKLPLILPSPPESEMAKLLCKRRMKQAIVDIVEESSQLPSNVASGVAEESDAA